MLRILTPLSVTAAIAIGMRFAQQPTVLRQLYFNKRYALHGVVPEDVLVHLCDLDDILTKDPSISDDVRRVFERVKGSVRAFYVAIQKNEPSHVIKHIGSKTRGMFTTLEAHAARSFFIGDLMRSLSFIGDSIMDEMLMPRQRP